MNFLTILKLLLTFRSKYVLRAFFRHHVFDEGSTASAIVSRPILAIENTETTAWSPSVAGAILTASSGLLPTSMHMTTTQEPEMSHRGGPFSEGKCVATMSFTAPTKEIDVILWKAN